MKVHAGHTLRTAAICGIALLALAGCNRKADNSINYTGAITPTMPRIPRASPAAHPVPPHRRPPPTRARPRPTTPSSIRACSSAPPPRRRSSSSPSKQVTNYDLSSQGRSAWTADTTQPGFGNFCYGHRSVSSIDSSTPTTSDVGATTQIAYHYAVSDAPAWASAAETRTAFPNLAADLSGSRAATATLTNTANGWQVTTAPDGRTPAASADSRIVQ